MFKKLLSFFSKDKDVISQRSPFDDFWYSSISALSQAGVNVTPENALKVSAIYACNKVISETIAGLPFLTYKVLDNGGKVRAKDHSLYKLLHVAPNNLQTSFEWRECMQTHLNLYGNAYSLIKRDYYGNILSLSVPIHPNDIREIELLEGDVLRYTINQNGRTEKIVLQDEIYHLRGTSVNGYKGISPILAGSNSIGLAKAAEIYGSNFFRNSARPSGALTHPQTLSDTAKDTLRKSIQVQGEHGIIVLEEGMKWEQLSTNAENAQYIQTRQFQIEEVCRWYRIQPHKIAHLLRSTFSNIEHQSLEFVTDTILPQIKRWEQRAAVCLFDDDDYFAEMLLEGLLRGDTKTRIEAYSKLIMTSQLSPNEGRILENRNPYEGGDVYYRPLNMQAVGEKTEAVVKTVPTDNKKAGEENITQKEQIEKITTAKNKKIKELKAVINEKKENELIENLVRNASERIVKAEKREIEKIGINTEKKEKFYNKHYEYIQKTLTPFGVKVEPKELTLNSGVDSEWLEDHIHSKIMEGINANS